MTEDTQAALPDEAPEPATNPRRPGKLRGRIEAKFNTGEAVALVDGRGQSRGKSRIIGLKGFARRSAIVLESSERGCPFADYGLVEIESKLDEVSAHMQAEGKRLNELAGERLDPGVSPEDSVAYTTTTWSVAPVEEEFILGHYSSRALYCLVQYDRLVLLAKGLQHHQVLTREECRDTIDTAGNMIRGLLAMGDSYQYSGCTRSDLREKNRVAQEAVAKLVERRFIDPRMFNDAEEIMKTFADYEPPVGSARKDSDSGTEAESNAAAESAESSDPSGPDVPEEQDAQAGAVDSGESTGQSGTAGPIEDSEPAESTDQEKP